MSKGLLGVLSILMVLCTATNAAAKDFAVQLRTGAKIQTGKTLQENQWVNAPLSVSAVTAAKAGDAWVRDLRIEFTNTSDKPIYFVTVALSFPDLTNGEGTVGFPLRYGRSTLSTIGTLPNATDPAIAPGQTLTLRLEENKVAAVKRWVRNHGLAVPARVRVNLQIASFGDGTQWNAGEVWDRESLEKAQAAFAEEPPVLSKDCGKRIVVVSCGCGHDPCIDLECGNIVSNFGTHRMKTNICIYYLDFGDERYCPWQEVYDCSGPNPN